MKLARLIQLLNFKRTAQLEREAAQLRVMSIELVGANRKLMGATEDLVAQLLGSSMNNQQAVDTALQMAANGSIASNLVEIQHLMASGRIKDAKLMVDSLVLVTRAEAS